jgi:hypothetical protein
MGGVFTIQMAVSRVAIMSAHFGYSFTWSKQVWFALATSGIMILNQQRALWEKIERSIQFITVLTASDIVKKLLPVWKDLVWVFGKETD